MAAPFSLPAATVTPGIVVEPPSGFYAYNFAPTLNSTYNSEIYDPNFIPGFRVGLTNVSLHWDAGIGYAHVGYSIGPWQDLQVALPHMAVGPQCCNFVEVPRTQQYRAEDWGDYYYVRGGFSSPGVNVPNFTSSFTAPADVGLRTDWQWIVSVSLNWKPPKLLNPRNGWAAVGIAATQYVPTAPNKLVYTVANFWMDSNSSDVLGKLPGSSASRMIASSHVVVYRTIQLADSQEGNQTIMVDLSAYLKDTLSTLGFASSSGEPPVISYVYLNIEGYNMQWNTTLFSFFVMSDHDPSGQRTFEISYLYYLIPLGIVSAVVFYLKIRRKE
jgi:hypothetical protein